MNPASWPPAPKQPSLVAPPQLIGLGISYDPSKPVEPENLLLKTRLDHFLEWCGYGGK